MPLNMNTVGTGSGIGGDSSTSDNIMVITPSEIYDTYSDVSPVYYISNSSFPKTRTLKNAGTAETYMQQIFIFKNELYAITINNPYIYTSSYNTSNNNIVAYMNKVTYSEGSLQFTRLFSFTTCIYYYIDDQRQYGRSQYSLDSRPLAIPSADYIYYASYIQVKTVDPGTGNTTFSYRDSLWRFDGTTSEEMIFSTPIGFSKARTFTQLDHACKRILVGSISSSSTSCYIIDVQKYTISTGTFPSGITTNVNGYYTPTLAVTYGMQIMDNMGYFIWGYGNTSGNYFRAWSTCGVSVNDDNSITLSNVTVQTTNRYYFFGEDYTTSECGIITRAVHYPGTSTYWCNPEMFIYNPETKLTTKYPTDSINGMLTGAYMVNDSNNPRSLTVIDHMNNNILYIATGADYSSNSDTDRITYVQYESINGVTYITNKSDTPESILHGYFKKGDTVYCSSKITDYKLSSVNSYTSYKSTRVFKIPSDGNYDIRSNHQIREYRSTWIVESVVGGFSFITINKISDTKISGYFIKDMIVNDQTITVDGKQELTFKDLNKTGVYVNMKGVK